MHNISYPFFFSFQLCHNFRDTLFYGYALFFCKSDCLLSILYFSTNIFLLYLQLV